MCGRFTLTTPALKIADLFEVPDPPLLTARYNIAPSQVIAVVGMKPDGKRRGLAMLKWGLVPNWASDPKSGPRPVNLRAESVRQKFGSLLRTRRCLIPADGFYEWVSQGGRKVPQRFTLDSGEVFAFAGIWDAWQKNGQTLLTCALITTTANELVRPVHDRMPVIIEPEDYRQWLDPKTPEREVDSMLVPFPTERMRMAAANPVLNSPKNDSPECLEAA